MDIPHNTTPSVIVDHLRNAPDSFSDTLTKVYANWCREYPASFQASHPPSISPPEIPGEIVTYINEFNQLLNRAGEDFKFSFPAILTSDCGIRLLWCLHETRDRNLQRALYSYMPILKPLENIRRGGINVYKRYSWTMHVMIVSRMLWNDLPQGSLPPTISWPEATYHWMTSLKSEYQLLNENEIKLLRLACVIHDIGVKDGVEGHDKKGIPYVQAAVASLGGSERISELLSGMLAPTEVVIALKALVGEHTLASKVNGETGPFHIREELNTWFSLAPNGSKLRHFLENSFPRLLALFLICDIVGVADELLTGPTIKRAIKSINYLSILMSSINIEAPTLEESAERLGILVGVEDANEVMALINEIFNSEDESRKILSTIGTAESLEYAMGILKPLKHPKAAIAVMADLAKRWGDLNESNNTQPMVLRFSPHCNLDMIRNWGEALLESSPSHGAILPERCGVEISSSRNLSAQELHVKTKQEQA